ncbi:hypothetical protein IAG25_39095 [Caballeronia sp. EK]|uniref:hypothetical protein n=1 Tax=Caballeronia sp. EK TaxID=2767469 RepID=UPI0019BA5BE4|nr:hypothetical protein [Caballeronia sp. EK]MBC8642799.1 hypothetical protein [Caballeronia sp. EK]
MNIEMLVLPGTLPPEDVIPAANLAARSEIESLRRRALAELEQAERDSIATREAALRATEEEVELLKRRARDAAISDAVRWMCTENDMERQIASQLTVRWRKLTAQIIEKLLGKSEHNELLLRRVEREVAEQLPHGALTLYVEPAALITAELIFADRPEVVVVSDAELAGGQAKLDNGLFCLHLDQREYQTKLIERLVNTGERVNHA